MWAIISFNLKKWKEVVVKGTTIVMDKYKAKM